jgi:hypothetical protein
MENFELHDSSLNKMSDMLRKKVHVIVNELSGEDLYFLLELLDSTKRTHNELDIS